MEQLTRPVRHHYCYLPEYRLRIQKRIVKLVEEGHTFDMMVTVLGSEGFKTMSMKGPIELKDVKNQVRSIRDNGGKATGGGKKKIKLSRVPVLTNQQQSLELPAPPKRSKVLVDPCIAQILLGNLSSTQKVEMLIGFHGLTAQYDSISKAL